MSLPRLLKNFFRVGPINAAKQLWRTEDIKAGTLMGVDQFGNQYFQNEKEEPWGRSRWVFYANKNYDASQVPPEWHMWLHRISDTTPTSKTYERQPWQSEHTENWTGTSKAFRTCNTTKPKYEYWEPKTSRT